MLLAFAAAGCVSETIQQTEDLTESESETVCQPSTAERVSEDVYNLCGCLVEDVRQVLATSCARGMSPELLDRVTQAMLEDCSEQLSACQATLGELYSCRQAANTEFAEACSVGFPEECLPFAVEPGCAFYVGCPNGFHIAATEGATSCVADGTPDAKIIAGAAADSESDLDSPASDDGSQDDDA